MNFPIQIKVEQQPVLIIGGGSVACRKARTLLKYGADITVISPEFHPDFDSLTPIHRVQRPYRSGDLTDACLVICATNRDDVNQSVWEEAQARHIPVNVVDQPQRCSFFIPSIEKKGDLTLAIATNGASPSLARKLRQRLAKEISPAFIQHVSLLKEIRPRVKNSELSPTQRIQVLKRMAEDDIENLIREKGPTAAREKLRQILRHARTRETPAPSTGTEKTKSAENKANKIGR